MSRKARCLAVARVAIGGAALALQLAVPLAPAFEASARTAVEPTSVCPPGAFALENPSFEQPGIGSGSLILPEAQVPGWRTTASDHDIEIWTSQAAGYAAPDGEQWAEINANSIGTLYQDVPTVPGSDVRYLVFHRGRTDPNTGQIQIGAPGRTPDLVRDMTDGPDAWGAYIGSYHVPVGQSVTRFAFAAITGTGPNASIGNFLDGMAFGVAACLSARETMTLPATRPPRPGDELTISVTVTNDGGFAAFDPLVHLAPPAGTSYVPGSLRLTDGPAPGPLTDAADADSGEMNAAGIGQVRLGAGEVLGIMWRGTTRGLSYRVRIDEVAAGSIVSDQRSVTYASEPRGAAQTAWSNAVAVAVPAAPTPSPSPTLSPTAGPTTGPTVHPTVSPSVSPTTSPTATPSPTWAPTPNPTPGGGPATAAPVPPRVPAASQTASPAGLVPQQSDALGRAGSQVILPPGAAAATKVAARHFPAGLAASGWQTRTAVTALGLVGFGLLLVGVGGLAVQRRDRRARRTRR